ncbi:MAG: metal ABC transporter substrate-binding protein, partial [Acidimicrobiales bacterium]
RAPVLDVVTGVYPIAQAAKQIGQTKVKVTDVVPPGADPLTYRLPPRATATVKAAGLVVLAGGGLQPSLRAAADQAHHVLTVDDALHSRDAYFWLDPTEMNKAVAAIASAMERANPPAAGLYRNGAQGFSEAVASTGIDYENTLSACPRRTVVTASGEFGPMSRSYDLHNLVVGTSPNPNPDDVGRAAAAVQAAGATTVFTEPWVSDATARAVAGAARVHLGTLDTLLGPPPGGWPSVANYVRLMEANLGALSAALGCPALGTGA